jgi:hypothetical protein
MGGAGVNEKIFGGSHDVILLALKLKYLQIFDLIILAIFKNLKRQKYLNFPPKNWKIARMTRAKISKKLRRVEFCFDISLFPTLPSVL